MIDYKKYEIKDFISDYSFRRWVIENSIEDGLAWEKWVNQNPDKFDTIEESRDILLFIESKYGKAGISAEEKEQELDKLIEKLDNGRIRNPLVISIFQMTWLKAAASVLIILSLGLLIYTKYHPTFFDQTVSGVTIQKTNETAYFFNSTKKPIVITLEDGSSVILQPQSRITYPVKFKSDKREILLSGEAFFEVEKNPLKPFFVHANGLTTKVLGTSFSISAYQNDKKVSVIVKTGKVTVFTDKQPEDRGDVKSIEKNAITLIHDEQVVYNKEKNTLQRSVVSISELKQFSIQQQSFEYDYTPVSQVFSDLESTYGITIVSDSTKMSNCFITGSLDDKPLKRKLELICSVVDGGYELKDNAIAISSNGCR